MTIVAETILCAGCSEEIDPDDYNTEYDCCDQCFPEYYQACPDCGVTVPCDEFNNAYDICDDCFRSNPIKYIESIVSGMTCGLTWAEYAERAEAISRVDFGCRFDCSGQCEGARLEDRRTRACCSGCVGNLGYLDTIPVEAVETIKAIWDDDKGFWTPDGCALPVKYRSRTCLMFQCGPARKTGCDISAARASFDAC